MLLPDMTRPLNCSYRGSHQFLYDVHVDKKNPVLSLMIGRISGIVGWS